MEYFFIAEYLVIENPIPQTDAAITKRMYREAYSYVTFQYLQVVANNLVTWAFSVKYWIVAYKVQLFQAE
jgi:hypothetical protein